MKEMLDSMIHIMMALILIKMFKNFENKLMFLILMEALFLMTILLYLTIKSEVMIMVFLMNIMVFMVLDSTMGISILISSSRNSSISLSQFKKI